MGTSLKNETSVLVEERNLFSLADVVVGAGADQFQPSSGKNTLGYLQNSYWLRIPVKNSTRDRWEGLLVSPSGHVFTSDAWLVRSSGMFERLRAPGKFRNEVFGVLLDSGEKATVYLRSSTPGLVSLDYRLFSLEAFARWYEIDLYVLLIVIGFGSPS